MIHSIKAETNQLLEPDYQEIKEHLFARVLLERSEEIASLSLEELKNKIIANFGLPAMAILENLLQETDLSYFSDHNDIKNLFELSNYAKLCYSDHPIRRRLIADLGYKYFCTIAKQEKQATVYLELLAYVADAIAFLTKNKLQFVEDFGCLFSVAEAVESNDPEFGVGKYDLGKRLHNFREDPTMTTNQTPGKKLRIRDFSASLQEAAYQDLTVGSYKASIPGWRSNPLTGFVAEIGESAYWDIFFWLCPGTWLLKNLQQVSLVI